MAVMSRSTTGKKSRPSSSLTMHSRLSIFIVLCVLASVLLQAQACMCPSCSMVDTAERCMCCVYRQLGKRTGTPNTGQPHQPTSLLRTADQSSPIVDTLRESPLASSTQPREAAMTSLFGDYPFRMRDADASYYQALLGLRPFMQTQKQKQSSLYDVDKIAELFQG